MADYFVETLIKKACCCMSAGVITGSFFRCCSEKATGAQQRFRETRLPLFRSFPEHQFRAYGDMQLYGTLPPRLGSSLTHSTHSNCFSTAVLLVKNEKVFKGCKLHLEHVRQRQGLFPRKLLRHYRPLYREFKFCLLAGQPWRMFKIELILNKNDYCSSIIQNIFVFCKIFRFKYNAI